MTTRHEQGPSEPTPMLNAAGVEVRPITMRDGRVLLLTLDEFNALDTNETDVPHSGVHHDEVPYRPDMPVTGVIHADDIAPTMPYDNTDKVKARELQSRPRWSMRQRIGAGALIVTATAGAVFGVSRAVGGNDTESALPDTSTSATPLPESNAPSATPTETETQPTDSPEPSQSPEQYTGPIDDAYVETVNRDPSDEVIAYSLEPVTADKFNDETAVMRLLNNWKIYWISGENRDSTDPNHLLTPESEALGVKQLEVMFGDEQTRNEDDLLWEWMTETREYLAINMDFLIPENGYAAEGTFNSTFDIKSSKTMFDGQVEFLVANDWTSNMNELDPRVATQDVDLKHHSADIYVTILKVDGVYHITKIRAANPANG